jgi:hypothetical protein
MRQISRVMAAVAFALLAGAVADALGLRPDCRLPSDGTTPNRSVKHWIKYLVFAPRQPAPIIQISTRRFKTCKFEHLVVLSQERYDVIAQLTQAQQDCVEKSPAGLLHDTLIVSEHDEGRSQTCTLLPAPACRYLSAVVRLPEMRWTEEERRTLRALVGGICDSDNAGREALFGDGSSPSP